MAKVVLDAGALLAYLRREPGADIVAAHLTGAIISAVDYAEVLRMAVERGASLLETLDVIELLQLLVVPFDIRQAEITAHLSRSLQKNALSPSLPCCLSLGIHTGRTVLTTNASWKRDDLEVHVDLIR